MNPIDMRHVWIRHRTSLVEVLRYTFLRRLCSYVLIPRLHPRMRVLSATAS